MKRRLLAILGLLFLLTFQGVNVPVGLLPSVSAVSAANQAPFTLKYPTYQFASWPGAGVKLLQGPTQWNDALVQQQYVTTASAVFPWGGFNYGTGGTNWCTNANTTSSQISGMNYGSGGAYSAWLQQLVLKYQMPFMIQEPLDGYGQCQSWANSARSQFPDLTTYNSTGQAITAYSYLRVDSIHFSVQMFNDLANIQANLRSTNPQVLNFWQGMYVSSIGADHGGYPKPGTQNLTGNRYANYMFGVPSIYNFANSPQCSTNCPELAQDAQRGQISQAVTLIQGQYNSWETWTNAEMILGLTYSAYNFSQKYLGGRPFYVVPAYNFFLQPSYYPAPYNTTYIESLNLLEKFQIGVGAYVDNGNPPTKSAVSADLRICKGNSPYGNEGMFVTAGGTYLNPAFPSYIRNMIYYEAVCAGVSLIAPGNLAYEPNTSGWDTMVAYGTILNRMRNLGTTGSTSPTVVSTDQTTGVTVISDSGTGLAWFYTNSTAGDVAKVTLSASSLGITTPWVAISALNWQIIARGSTDTISLTARIPAQGWNPIYLIGAGQVGQPAYSNAPITWQANGLGANAYTTSTPQDFSTWLVIRSSTVPTSVTSSNTGPLPYVNTLTALNSSVIGMKWTGSSFVNQTQTGWFFDSMDNLTIIHFIGGARVTITVVGQSQSATTTSTTTASSTFLSSTASSTTSETPIGTTTTETQAGTTSVISTLATTSASWAEQTSESSTSSSGSAPSGNCTVSLVALPDAGGRVSPSSGNYTIQKGVPVKFYAYPVVGWHLSYWLLNDSSPVMPANLTLTIQGNTKVAAIFSKDGQTSTVLTDNSQVLPGGAHQEGPSSGVWLGPVFLSNSNVVLIASGALIAAVALEMRRRNHSVR